MGPSSFPAWQKHLATVKKPRRLLNYMAEIHSLEPYLDAEAIRRAPRPTPLSAEDWWTVIKLQRACASQILDLPNGNWSYAPTPTILQRQDLLMSAQCVGDPAQKDRYNISAATLEAIHSCRLDGIQVKRSPEAKHAIRSHQAPAAPDLRAAWEVFHLLRRGDAEASDQPLTPTLLREIAQSLTSPTGNDVDVPSSPQVQVLPADDAMVALNAFLECRATDPHLYVPPLVRATAAYAWLQDALGEGAASGRLARVLFNWSAKRLGIEVIGTVSWSGILARTPKKNARKLRQTVSDDHDLNYFLLHHLETLERALRERDQRIARKETGELDTPAQAGLNHRQRALLHCSRERPETVFTIAVHQEAHGIVYETARTDLAILARRGFLVREKSRRTFVYRPAATRRS